MPPVTSVGSLCEIHAVLCSKIADVHEVEVHDFRLENLFILGQITDFYCTTPET